MLSHPPPPPGPPPPPLSQFTKPCSPEEFGLALAQHFVREYPKTVWKAKVAGEPGVAGHAAAGMLGGPASGSRRRSWAALLRDAV